MLSIFICENNPTQRKQLENIVENYIDTENVNIKLVLSTGDPAKILKYLDKHPGFPGLYFLDINLGHEINGITLATKIREQDLFGHIVFVSVHIELSATIFAHNIEALDFIMKGQKQEDIKNNILHCIDISYQRYLRTQGTDQQKFQVNIYGKIHIFSFDEIMFFETSDISRNIILHLENEQKQISYALRDAEDYSTTFFRCHRSYVVNLQNIQYVDKEKLEIKMRNGEVCLLSARKLRELKKMLTSLIK
ncbi:MAG: LytTR family DNA-binding domain-containing protein [Lachnospiraceae bacterium]|nr:LytTR family DNA-binding domain-containing protein [Lachnospiraceae bacterium]